MRRKPRAATTAKGEQADLDEHEQQQQRVVDEAISPGQPHAAYVPRAPRDR